MRFSPNRAGIEALQRTPAMRRHIARATADLVNAVVIEAPTDLLLESETTTDASGTVGRVGARHPGAVAIEFGSINNAPYAPFRRAVRIVGLRLRERF